MPEVLLFILALLALQVLIAIYAAPAIVALRRNHPQKIPIILLNILLGATFIGWVVALVWASSSFPMTASSTDKS